VLLLLGAHSKVVGAAYSGLLSQLGHRDVTDGQRVKWRRYFRRREKQSLSQLNRDVPRCSAEGGSGESVAALSATGRRDSRRLRGRMMYETTPAKSAKRTTTTTDTASVVIFRAPRMLHKIRRSLPAREASGSIARPQGRCLGVGTQRRTVHRRAAPAGDR
jgi:hypothetical protein